MTADFATGCCPTVFVIADLHFGDAATCRQGRRPFADVSEMQSEISRRWNAMVLPSDTVYVLGDIGKRHHVNAVSHLNGKKHLVAGNGDDIGAIMGSGVFESVTIARRLRGVLLTHIPVHPSQLRGRTINVHGHLHSTTIDDPRYRCVSVEQTDFAPVRLDSL